MKRSFLKLLVPIAFAYTMLAAKPVTLTMWIMNNSPRPVSEIKKFTKQFESENPDIKINVELVNWGEAWTKMKIASKEKRGPDITQMGTTWVPHFASQGMFYNLKPHLKQFGGQNSFFESTWSTTHSDENPEKIVALPWFLDNKLLMINQDLYDQFDFEDSDFRDWKSTKSALTQVKEAHLLNESGHRIWPFAFPGFRTFNVVHNLAPWLWSGGGSFLKKTNGKWHSNLSDTNSIEALKYYISFMKDGIVNYQDLDQSNTYIDNLYIEGKVFLYLSGTGQLMTEAKGERGYNLSFKSKYLPIPRSSRGSKQQFSFLGGSNLGITSFSKHKQEALKLLIYLLNDKNNAEYSYNIGAIGTKKTFRKYLNFQDTSNLDILEQNVKNGRSYPNTPYWADLVLPFKHGLIKLFLMASGAYGEYTDFDVRQQTLLIDSLINEQIGLSQGFKDTLRLYYDKQFEVRMKHKTSRFSQTFSKKPEDSWFAVTLLIACILIFTAIVIIKRLNRG